MAAAPTLLFCVGATKAGTSWLHEALAEHPECHLRSIKELHFFDALAKGRLDRERQQTETARAELEARLAKAPLGRVPALTRRIADRAEWLEVLADDSGDVSAYLGYLEAGRDDAKVVGDVTPAYALLPVAQLGRMAALRPDVRFVYILRDPVDRLWSHVRMMARRRGQTGEADPRRAARILDRTLAGDEREIEIRGDYAGALTRLRQAVAPERLLVMFYEELFAPGGLEQLCRFLDIAPQPGDAGRRVHQGAALDMTPEQRARARDWLAPQYDFVRAELGRVPAGWGDTMAPVSGAAG